MTQYISKAAVLAEIERLAKENNESENVYDFGTEHALKSILSFINALEVKEVNLKKELSYEDYIKFFDEHPNFPDDWGFDEAWVFAKYFYELGLASQLTWQDIRLISEIGEEFMNSEESDNCTNDETYYSAILNKFKQLGRGYKTQRQEIRDKVKKGEKV